MEPTGRVRRGWGEKGEKNKGKDPRVSAGGKTSLEEKGKYLEKPGKGVTGKRREGYRKRNVWCVRTPRKGRIEAKGEKKNIRRTRWKEKKQEKMPTSADCTSNGKEIPGGGEPSRYSEKDAGEKGIKGKEKGTLTNTRGEENKNIDSHAKGKGAKNQKKG